MVAFSIIRKNFSQNFKVLRLQAAITRNDYRSPEIRYQMIPCLVSIVTVRINSKLFPWFVRTVQETGLNFSATYVRCSTAEYWFPQYRTSVRCPILDKPVRRCAVWHTDMEGKQAELETESK